MGKGTLLVSVSSVSSVVRIFLASVLFVSSVLKTFLILGVLFSLLPKSRWSLVGERLWSFGEVEAAKDGRAHLGLNPQTLL